MGRRGSPWAPIIVTNTGKVRQPVKTETQSLAWRTWKTSNRKIEYSEFKQSWPHKSDAPSIFRGSRSVPELAKAPRPKVEPLEGGAVQEVHFFKPLPYQWQDQSITLHTHRPPNDEHHCPPPPAPPRVKRQAHLWDMCSWLCCVLYVCTWRFCSVCEHHSRFICASR